MDSEKILTETEEDEQKFVLSEWGCLYAVLTDYGIDVDSIPGRVGKHIVEDFMELMCTAGYVEEKGGEQDNGDQSKEVE